MKHRALLFSILASFTILATANSQNAKPGSITFRNIQGSAFSQNLTTGLTDPITDQTLLSQGFKVTTENDTFLDLLFSNGVIARVAPGTSLEIAHFSTSSIRATTQARDSFGVSDSPMLEIKLLSGELLVNAESKQSGRLVVTTDKATIESEPTKFLVAHGAQVWEGAFATRATNLGTAPITVTSRVGEQLNDPGQPATTYSIFNVSAQQQTRFVGRNQSAIVLDPAPSEQTKDRTPGLQTLSLAPLDDDQKDELTQVADHLLTQGPDPLGTALVVYAGPDATYLNLNTGETGTLENGMTVTEGTIIRTLGSGSVDILFANGANLLVEAFSSVYIQDIASHPFIGANGLEHVTKISARVESGKMVANTHNGGSRDLFEVISPLDMHRFTSGATVSVEFKQVDTNAFQAITQNMTQGGNAVVTTVVSSERLTFVSELATFIAFDSSGSQVTFDTLPLFTHITESAIIPPTYAFIDRTIAFAAPGTATGPTPMGTPSNPGNILQTNTGTDPDPVSP